MSDTCVSLSNLIGLAFPAKCVMPKRAERDPSFHYLAMRVTQNSTRLHNPVNCTMVPVSDRYDDDVEYTSIINAVNTMGPDTYEMIMTVSVNRPSKSQAFLKLLSILPDAKEASLTL